MTIELDEKSYIIGMWFSSDPVTSNNWLACAIRDQGNPLAFKGSYRFRYVKDDKIFDGEDEKSWYSFSLPQGVTEESIIETMDLAQAEIESGYPEKDKVIVKGNLKLLMELAKDKEWMHIKMVKPEEIHE